MVNMLYDQLNISKKKCINIGNRRSWIDLRNPFPAFLFLRTLADFEF